MKSKPSRLAEDTCCDSNHGSKRVLSRGHVLPWYAVENTKTLSSGARLIRQARTLLIGTTVLWGLSFPLVRGLELAQKAHAPHVPDAAVACADVAMRFGLSVLVLLPILGRHLLRVSGREWSQAAGLAFFAAGGLYLQALGLAWTDASIAAFLTQLFTLIVPLIVAVRDRRLPSLRVVIACSLVLTGAALLSPGLLKHFVLGAGEVVIIISAFFIAAQIVWIERPIYAKNRAGVVTLIMFALLAAIFAAGFFSIGGTIHSAGNIFGTPPIWTLSLALVLLCTVFNFFIMNAWQRCVSATEAGLIYCLEPVIATLLSGFLPGWISRFAAVSYPNEILTWTLLVGGALIVSATVLVATERRAA
jgi:drug/metabolite transporter (DMT)-like permease